MASAIITFNAVLCMLGLCGSPDGEGVGAYYHQRPELMREVCERRVAEGWNPGLDCSFPCLAAGMRPEEIGSYVLADLPGHSLVV